VPSFAELLVIKCRPASGRRPACCPCRWVHSCANMDSPAGVHSV